MSDPVPETNPAPQPAPQANQSLVISWINSALSKVSQRWIDYVVLFLLYLLLNKLGIIFPKPEIPDVPVFLEAKLNDLQDENSLASKAFNGQEMDTKQGRVVGVHIDDNEFVVADGFRGGWIPSPSTVEAFRAKLPEPWFSDTPAGKVFLNDNDVFLWQAAELVLKKPLEPRNQGQVGSCVAFGTAAAIDVLQLVQIASGEPLEYKPSVQEAIYALSRVEIGGGRISGDGSVGSWAAQAVKEGRYGILPREQVLTYDLRVYSESRCRDWGRRGLPDELEPIARKSPIKSYTFCRTTDDIDRALAQGYPIALCSMLGVSQQRDANGFSRYDRSWAHCMAVLGRRTDIEGYFIWNSWGSGYHRGPKGVGNPPDGGFWLSKSDMQRVLRDRNTECIAFSDATGFPARKIEWIVRQPNIKNNRLFASIFK